MIAKVKRHSESNPNKIVFATGDNNQLETTDAVSNQIDYEFWTDHCISTIFPNSITLRTNECLKSQADKGTLR